MSMVTVNGGHMLKCDAPGGCPVKAPAAAGEPVHAARAARAAGWDIGPCELRPGIIEFADYCRGHRHLRVNRVEHAHR